MKIFEENELKKLLLRLNKGDEQAFNALYQGYRKPLYYRIIYLVKDPDVADELSQELFMKVWENRTALDADRSFNAYVYTIAQNLVYSYFRKIAVNKALLQSLAQNPVDEYLNGEQLLENKQIDTLLQQAMNLLTPQRREVFRLCKLEGKSYEETGKLLNISVATVNSHMTKSLHTIREYLTSHQDSMLVILGAYTAAILCK